MSAYREPALVEQPARTVERWSPDPIAIALAIVLSVVCVSVGLGLGDAMRCDVSRPFGTDRVELYVCRGGP
jgi:hypothetical protein